MGEDFPMDFTFTPVGLFHTPYGSTDAIPKAFGETPSAQGTIEIFPEYEKGLLKIEAFTHLLVIFAFHRSGKKPLTVTPPTREEERGVFASRSPHRPNPIGVLTVRLLKREGNILFVSGLDVLDGTPVLDIKPYLRHFDCRPESRAGI